MTFQAAASLYGHGFYWVGSIVKQAALPQDGLVVGAVHGPRASMTNVILDQVWVSYSFEYT